MDENDSFIRACALRWLVASQRPVLATELHAIIRIARDMNVSNEVMNPARVEEYSEEIVISTITTLLGAELVKLYRNDTNPDRLYVRFSLPRPHSRRNEDLNFTLAGSHGYATKVCLEICLVTTSQLAYFRTQKHHLADLIEYAWMYWSVHMFLSREFRLRITHRERFFVVGPAFMFVNYDLKPIFRDIWVDAAKFLVTLNNHLTNLGQHPGTGQYLLLTKHALDSLEFPLDWLSSMVRADSDSEDSCHSAIDILYDAWNQSKEKQLSDYIARRSDPRYGEYEYLLHMPLHDETPGLVLEPSRLRSFDTENFLKLVHSPVSCLGDREKAFMEELTMAAQNLRALSVTIAKSPLFDKLSKDGYSNGSPLDTIVYVAHFLESVVSFPLWNRMGLVHFERSWGLIDPHIKLNSREFRRRWDGRQHGLPHEVDGNLRRNLVVSSPPLSLRLSSAQLFVTNVKRLCRSNEDDKTKAGNSEEHQHQEDQNYPVSILLGHLHSSTGFGYVTFTEGITERYVQLKNMMLANGYRVAFALIIMAIIVNQNRTMFYPWLGVDVWQNPMEQLRLARSNPEVFLDEFHSSAWMDIFFSTLQRWACEFLAALALKFTITGSTRRQSGRKLDPWPLFTGILYLAWIFTAVENLFSRGVNSCAIVTAVWKLASSKSEAWQIAFNIVAKKHWLKMGYVLLTRCFFISDTVLPICKDSLRFALKGQLGMSLFFGFIAIMVRAVIMYRSVFFIPLEISGMFVAIGWATVGFWILCMWFFDDPLGLKLTIALARFRGDRAEKQIERGSVKTLPRMRIWYRTFGQFLSGL